MDRRPTRVRGAARVLSLTAPVLCAGCWNPPPPTVEQTQRGLVYLFPGIEGGAWSMQWAYRGFREAGVDAEIRILDWQRPFRPLANLTEHDQNRAKAAGVAAELAAFRRERPEATMDLVGYSGGGGMALMVVEALPADVRLRNVVLVQPAVSPRYDLTAALRRIDGTLVNFYCPSDWLVLGVGTKVLGTMDRAYVASAGKEGFDVEAAVPDEALREKLEQRAWSSEMVRSGHLGNHMSIILGGWNRRYVAPYLLPAGAGAPPAEPPAMPAAAKS